ncbi:hypothetical protein [Qipengyuania spongiae]|uniref:Uncharacterized protein n=1 Tax=Qipengyuania spongiae TaxID=2909673 RepID=A0ABY5T2H3_9SPHN|nr:hypothetical protein [Qipengyuania spongiae]UVI40625.1 hypothetical protein L1F33_06710 [Qipengyuania spongiae]
MPLVRNQVTTGRPRLTPPARLRRRPPATPAPAETSPADSTAPAGYTDGQGINEGYPDLTPATLTPEAERTEAGARNVLISFARAIEMREYDQAWNMLSRQAGTKWTKAQFNELFRGLSDITVAVPDGRMEGAAGSSYYTSQATITATDADGRPIRIEGPIVLSRVNDVPGSTAEDRRWHIRSADLEWTH